MTDIQSMANAIRFLALDSILNAREGHQGVPLGMAEIAATLYARHLKVDPKNPLWPDRDRVVLSNGHGSMLLYSLLHLAGYAHITTDALKSFRKLESVCAGHPEIEQEAGIELTTGLLGQGIACSVGMAVAEARLAAQFGADLVDHRTWVFVGDGCLQEGVGQEAISLAGHLRLGKLTFLWDDNHITDDGDTGLSISEDVPARFRAAHWQVEEVDGHDIEAISAAMDAAKADPRPTLIACRTVIARGIPRLQGQRGGHTAPLTEADAREARALLDWHHAPFELPDNVRHDWAASMSRGSQEHAAWQSRLNGHPFAVAFNQWTQSELPNDWNATVQAITAHQAAITDPRPTIQSSGEICDALSQTLPDTIVLCADLEAPTNHKRSRTAFTASEPVRKLCSLRRARTPDGGNVRRDRRARRIAARECHLPCLRRLREARDAHGRSHGSSRPICIQSRQHRRRQQRADTPTRRDSRQFPRHAEHKSVPPSRRRRNRRSLGTRDGGHRRPEFACIVPTAGHAGA